MTKQQKVKVILACIDEAYSIPSYMEDDVLFSIEKALTLIYQNDKRDCQIAALECALQYVPGTDDNHSASMLMDMLKTLRKEEK